jgi:hypothetical protein
MLSVTGTRTYSLPVFLVTTDVEWERIDFRSAMSD